MSEVRQPFENSENIPTAQCFNVHGSLLILQTKKVKGLDWSAGAIGNAVWSGARLHDVLMYCGLKDYSNIRHVQVS